MADGKSYVVRTNAQSATPTTPVSSVAQQVTSTTTTATPPNQIIVKNAQGNTHTVIAEDPAAELVYPSSVCSKPNFYAYLW